MPEQVNGRYPAKASIGRNIADDRQVITIVELDIPPERFAAVSATLTRPGALDRIAQLVESTQLEGVYEQVLDDASF